MVANLSQCDRALNPWLPHPRGLDSLFTSLPWTQESQRLTGRMEVWSPQCHWSFPVAKGVMVGVEVPVLSEAPGLGESSQVGCYLMTQARRV